MEKRFNDKFLKVLEDFCDNTDINTGFVTNKDVIGIDNYNCLSVQLSYFPKTYRESKNRIFWPYVLRLTTCEDKFKVSLTWLGIYNYETKTYDDPREVVKEWDNELGEDVYNTILNHYIHHPYPNRYYRPEDRV